jgi:hypothetical protein
MNMHYPVLRYPHTWICRKMQLFLHIFLHIFLKQH